MSTDPAIQHQQPRFMHPFEAVKLTARKAHLAPHPQRLDATSLDPAPHRDRMDSEFLGGLPHTQEFCRLLPHDDYPSECIR